MIELGNREITTQLAIDSRQEILVERRCDPGRVVVSGFKDVRGFYQIDTNQESVLSAHSFANRCDERDRVRAIEIPDIAAYEKKQARSTQVGNNRDGVSIFGGDRGNRELIDFTQQRLRGGLQETSEEISMGI